MTSAPSSSSNQPRLQVLYLDYDGVLHHDAVFRSPKRGIFIDANVAPGHRLFEWTEVLVQALRPYSELGIVLSTSWVRALGFTKARNHLPTELSSRVIGATFHGRAHREDAVLSDSILRPSRGVEVMADVARRRPGQWVAVDDTDEGWPDEHRDRVVLCDSSKGLSASSTRARLEVVLNSHFGPASVSSLVLPTSFSDPPVSINENSRPR